MPAMDPPKTEKIISEKEARKIIRYLGLSSRERKALQAKEKVYKALLRPYMDINGHSKITCTDGSYAKLEDTTRKTWMYDKIAEALGIDKEELEKKYSFGKPGTRLTCRPPA